MRFLVLWSLLLIALPAVANPLRVDGQIFRDKLGNQVLLRGVNVSGASKVPPFRAISSADDFRPLQGWGFNSIRLLFNWEAFEANRGEYDEGYLSYYVGVIRWAQEHNLYVIVDIHQDAFSRFTAGGCGEGFPEWAVPPTVIPVEPRNDENCKSWGITTVIDPNMHKSWSEFYRNTAGVRDQYLLMLRRLARAVGGEENVIGINLLNEPWGDEKTDLYDLYTDAALIVRQEFPASILFLSAAAKSSTGLLSSELPRIAGENLVHETHYYDPQISGGSWSQWILEVSALAWKRIASEWQAPLYLGEFGAPPTLKDAATYVERIYELLDREAYSAAYWVYTPSWNEETKDGWNFEDFSINNSEGELRGLYSPRPWLERISTRLNTMKWAKDSAKLTLEYDAPKAGRFELVVPSGYQLLDVEAGFDKIACDQIASFRMACNFPKAFLWNKGKATVHFQTQDL